MYWSRSEIRAATRFAEGFMLRRFGRRMINAREAEDFVMSLIAQGHEGAWKSALAFDIIDAYRSERGRGRHGRDHLKRKFVALPFAMRAAKRQRDDTDEAIDSMGLTPVHRMVVRWLLRGDQQRHIAMRLGVSETRVTQIRQDIEAHLSQHSLWRDLVARHSRLQGKQVESEP